MSLDGLTNNLSRFSALVKELGSYALCSAIIISSVIFGIPITPELVVEAAAAGTVGQVVLAVGSFASSKIEAKVRIKKRTVEAHKSEGQQNLGSLTEEEVCKT